MSVLDAYHDYVSLQVGEKVARLEVNSAGHVRLKVGKLYLPGVSLPKRALRRLRQKLGRPACLAWEGAS